MFSSFFILVPLFSISHFHKKSKSIGFQLRPNRQKHKILHNPSTVMCEMMNGGALLSEKPTTFRVILNYKLILDLQLLSFLFYFIAFCR